MLLMLFAAVFALMGPVLGIKTEFAKTMVGVIATLLLVPAWGIARPFPIVRCAAVITEQAR
ncbi:hypothetical protein [Erythrobacter sanguineus]|jgi:hypothetical protein|uniref:Uncharacterized protein n=1 Tax=Erythrobacter sanguineus TaxID=198312 RepID=A0A1M7SYT2_9SPHN|nr:hypothetical protein [Erythrobacter sanguineus]SHN63598.1 hypothetical protein SAMN02745193_02616 [Erythrobacter sanguineus]